MKRKSNEIFENFMIYPQKGKRKKRGRPKEVRQEGEVTKESKDEVKSDMQKEHFNVTRLRHPLEVWGPTWCQALDPGYQRNNTANEPQTHLPHTLFQVQTAASRLQLKGRRSVNALGSPFSPEGANDDVFSHILHRKAKAKSKVEAYTHFLQVYRYDFELSTLVIPIMSIFLAALIS